MNRSGGCRSQVAEQPVFPAGGDSWEMGGEGRGALASRRQKGSRWICGKAKI